MLTSGAVILDGCHFSQRNTVKAFCRRLFCGHRGAPPACHECDKAEKVRYFNNVFMEPPVLFPLLGVDNPECEKVPIKKGRKISGPFLILPNLQPAGHFRFGSSVFIAECKQPLFCSSSTSRKFRRVGHLRSEKLRYALDFRKFSGMRIRN
jgi:hypothetical protein